MLTAVLAVGCVLLLIALGTFALLWRAAALDNRHKARIIRHQRERIDGYRADLDACNHRLDALSIAPPAACAALTPDAEPPIPAGWLDDLNTLPTTHEREYPL